MLLFFRLNDKIVPGSFVYTLAAGESEAFLPTPVPFQELSFVEKITLWEE